ncbi:hypothetical protein MMC25_001917 [Agyrium rufum]|nr:hypothetical protein [Agyrium rufum]
MAEQNTSTSITVLSLAYNDIPGAIDSIQLAFADDPYNKWIYPDRAAFSAARNRVSLGIRCMWGIENAMFFVAKDLGAATASERNRVLGIAMWMPPSKVGNPLSWNQWYQSWLLWARQVQMNLWWGRGGLNVKWDDEEGYYFCNIVTVLPDQQGRGIGKLLFKEVTDRADREGRKCYLESSRDEPNTKIYEKLGFRKVREMDCNDDGAVCQLYCMMRDPKLSSS